MQCEDNLHELCDLGKRLRGLITSHPSDWSFGSWNEARFIVLVPALSRDMEQVIARVMENVSSKDTEAGKK